MRFFIFIFLKQSIFCIQSKHKSNVELLFIQLPVCVAALSCFSIFLAKLSVTAISILIAASVFSRVNKFYCYISLSFFNWNLHLLFIFYTFMSAKLNHIFSIVSIKHLNAKLCIIQQLFVFFIVICLLLYSDVILS